MEIETGTVREGVVERPFELVRATRTIPGMLWEPALPSEESDPVVMIGHGGGGSSAEGYVVALGRALARTWSITSFAIDGPVHGRRRGDRPSDQALVMLDFSQAWANDPSMTDEMVADWRATLGALHDELDLDSRPLGWWGLSMGTILGLPVVAAEPRISACVLGLAGVIGPTAERLATDAQAVACPTLFLAQREDELFGFDPVVALYDALAAPDKQLRVSPGTHAQVSVETFAATMDFLDGRLRGICSPERSRPH